MPSGCILAGLIALYYAEGRHGLGGRFTPVDSVRHVVSSSTGTRVVFGAFEHDVEIWDVAARSQASAFTTNFDFGGARLALSDTEDVLVAAAYHRFGLEGYSASSGEVRWKRRSSAPPHAPSVFRRSRTF